MISKTIEQIFLCFIQRNKMPPKRTQEEVALIFEQKGHKLVGEYTGRTYAMEFMCSCGGRGKASYSRLTSKSFAGCEECVRKKRGILTHEEAKEIFALKGFQLLSEYKSSSQKLEFVCSCGRTATVSNINKMRSPTFRGCPFCKVEGIKKTCLERYGSVTPLQAPEIREKIVAGWKEKWGVENPLQNPEIRKKCKETMLEKYGVENTMESAVLVEKTKKNNLEKYGVDNPMKVEKFREVFKKSLADKTQEQKDETSRKKERTMLERYGNINAMANPDIVKKQQETCEQRHGNKHPIRLEKFKEEYRLSCIQKYGVDNPMKLKETQLKSRETYKAKTGYDHPSQNPEVARKILKSSLRKKEFIMPSGSPFICQGFEPLALQLLLDEGIDEQDILSPSEQGIKIPYEFQGKSHMYHPDIFVPSLNLLIEVKSDWTFGGCGGKKKDEAERTLKKLAACREQGYNTRLYVFDKNNNLASFHERISPTNF
ncbi:MutH/Vsr/archaeal HJR-like endonuclease [Marseillevirus marseillevirus]|uniref:MutH/Vsr/archaeal HJR-like endonuclease n=1 Tax=Marseillevirus marseillevirus TaxID=694581 RepID=D2XAP8_GBMV|nr:endonuclease [Marseillevirus marseillevirus]ADB04025.1 MutH/Vsr/archaeal HJR-like endonuclease [Marseillevirus marseillevirus]